MDRNFSDDVKIDRFALEKVAEEHPSIYLSWAEELANSRSEVDRLKDQIELKSAEKDLAYRKNPPDGLKVTEAVIASLVTADLEIRTLRQQLDLARTSFNTLQAGVTALDHKKGMLDNLVRLWISGYYATPGGSRSASDDKSDALRNGLNRRAKENQE